MTQLIILDKTFLKHDVHFKYGGFKFEAQRALKIDGTPLKVF